MLKLQAETSIDLAIEVVSDLILELSVSSELTGVDEQLQQSLAEDLAHESEVDRVQQELYQQEPYRLKLGAMRAKLQATRERIRSGEGHVHGKDYGDSAELQADFDMLRDALRRHGGERAADGALAIAQQVLAASGLNLATLDVREHSEKHHEVLARLFDRVGRAGPSLLRAQPRRADDRARARARQPAARWWARRSPRTSRSSTTPPAPPTTCSGRSGDAHRLYGTSVIETYIISDDPRRR